MQVKKKPKSRLNGIGLKLIKLLLQLIRCTKSRRKLSVRNRQLNVVVLQLRKRFNILLTCKLKESFKWPKKLLKMQLNFSAKIEFHLQRSPNKC